MKSEDIQFVIDKIQARRAAHPDKPYTWVELENISTYSRQSLHAKQVILEEFQRSKLLASSLCSTADQAAKARIEPGVKILQLEQELDKAKKQRDHHKQQHQNCLIEVTRMQEFCLQVGITIPVLGEG